MKQETDILKRIKEKFPEEWRIFAFNMFLQLHGNNESSLEYFDLYEWLRGVVEKAPDIVFEQKEK